MNLQSKEEQFKSMYGYYKDGICKFVSIVKDDMLNVSYDELGTDCILSEKTMRRIGKIDMKKELYLSTTIKLALCIDLPLSQFFGIIESLSDMDDTALIRTNYEFWKSFKSQYPDRKLKDLKLRVKLLTTHLMAMKAFRDMSPMELDEDEIDKLMDGFFVFFQN